MKLNKQLFTDIAILATASVILGIVYNLFSDKPLAWFAEEKKYDSVSDDFFVADTMATTPTKQPVLADTATATAAPNTMADTGARQPKSSTQVEDILKKNISYEQMKRQMTNPNVVIVDARPETLFEAGHIGNAINIHPYWAEDVYMPKLVALPQDKIIIVYCDGGDCDLSHHVAKDLLELGFTKVAIYYGGWAEWVLHK